MPQSNVIFFYLFAAFVIYVTMRGELPVYMGFLFSSAQQPDIIRSDVADVKSETSVADTAATIAKAAQFAAMVI